MVAIKDSIMLMQKTLGVGTKEDQRVFNVLSEKIRYNAELTLLKGVIHDNKDIQASLKIISDKISELEEKIKRLKESKQNSEELSKLEKFLKMLKEQREFLLSNNYEGYVWNIQNNANMQSLIDECAMELKYRFSRIASLFGENLVEEVYDEGSKVPHFTIKKDLVEFIFSIVTNNKLMNNLRVLNAIDQKITLCEADIRQIKEFIKSLYLLIDSEDDILAIYQEHLGEYEKHKQEMSIIKNQHKQIKARVKEYEKRLFTSLTNSSKLKYLHHRLDFLREKYDYHKELKHAEEDIILHFIEGLEDEGLRRIFSAHFNLVKSKQTGKGLSIDKIKDNVASSISNEDDFYDLIAKHLDGLNLDTILGIIDVLKKECTKIEDDRKLTLEEASKYKKFLNKKIIELAKMDYASCISILDIFDKKYEMGLNPIMIITVLMICIKLKELKISDLEELLKKDERESLVVYFKNIIDKKAKHDLDITVSLIESEGRESIDSRLSLI